MEVPRALPVGLHGYGTYCQPSNSRTEVFLFGGISPPNKTFFLRVLSAFAVKMLFWTGMICHFTLDTG
jgi:hypothetical protein